MEKCYTPKIEEFHMGFEFAEEFENTNWYKIIKTFNKEFQFIKLKLDTSHPISRIISKIKDNRIKVKYLNKEDLKSLGFNPIDENNCFELTENDILSLEYFEKDKGWFLTYSENESQFSFAGWIKNKSELKKLMSQLNMNLKNK